MPSAAPVWPQPFVALPRTTATPADHPSASVEAPELVFDNGFGGFSPDGREYVVVLNGDADTPLPWVNVLSNEHFGTVLGTTGAAWTWSA